MRINQRSRYKELRQTTFRSLGGNRGVNSCPNLLTNLDTGRFRRPESVRPASVPSSFRQVIGSGVASQANQAGTLPLKPARSPTTLHVCSHAYGPGLPSSGCPSSRLFPSGICPDRALTTTSATRRDLGWWFLFRLPMPLVIKRVMHIDGCIMIRIGLIMTNRTAEDLAPLFFDPRAITV